MSSMTEGLRTSGRGGARRPWHRQFWVWFVIAIPLSAVIMGITVLYLAVTTSDGLVVDDYYRQGLAINRVLDRDRKAAQLGLLARVSVRPGGQSVLRVNLQGGHPKALRVRLLHPTIPDHDVDGVATLDDQGLYVMALGALPPGYWHLQIEPAGDAQWRLVGRIHLPEADFIEISPRR